MNAFRTSAAALLLAMPLLAQAAPGINDEIRSDMKDARKDMRLDLAKARQELLTENLRIDNSLQFGKGGHQDRHLPRAEITPQGDFLIEGKAQAIGADQRRELLVYRKLVIDVAMRGIDIGERSGQAALDAVGTSWVGMLFGAMTGGLERRVERVVKQEIEPGVRQICRQLPEVRDAQQRLAAGIASFRPYATLEADDIRDCEADVRREFASR